MRIGERRGVAVELGNISIEKARKEEEAAENLQEALEMKILVEGMSVA